MPEISGWTWGRSKPVATAGTSTEGDNV
jgi:hypothetical protein